MCDVLLAKQFPGKDFFFLHKKGQTKASPTFLPLDSVCAGVAPSCCDHLLTVAGTGWLNARKPQRQPWGHGGERGHPQRATTHPAKDGELLSSLYRTGKTEGSGETQGRVAGEGQAV